ncbi:LytR/AlgR family response regulator transcription factor [Parapedobacter koreensis]|uniref:Two component transcriptional regulator, LytTR family n=1 Tax=Parapedobacter koreensis TaxID=332977 RepID=A0A1H7SJL4_9SPHI|nr:LytTR family DNA-binding domain-containing protein [Parapedobacter koreensis]SEL72861.1 two component transcriptional regulator, LytTR family [Parapedobacter koreensis]
MIQTIIIDDDPHCVSALLHDLARLCPQIRVVATCQSGKKGIAAIRKHNPELVFLDIEMLAMDGFDMLETLGEGRGFQVVFTSAYDEFTLKAIRINAVDYLLKPIGEAELTQAVGRVERHLKTTMHTDEHISNLLRQIQRDDEQHIALPNRNGYEFISVHDIIYCQADRSYTLFKLTDDRKILVSKALGEVEELLPERFFVRIHHSTVVNIKKIVHLRKLKTSVIALTNGEYLNVSRARRHELLLRMGVK